MIFLMYGFRIINVGITNRGKYMKTSLSGISKASLLILSAVQGVPIFAQDEKSTAGALEEVVVTASRRAQSLSDVPYNISAVTGAEIDEKGIQDVTELLRSSPGVIFNDKGPGTGLANQSGSLVIRGVNTGAMNRVAGPSAAAGTVSTYINETPVYVDLRLKDIERVEVLRGPQGTLYGSSALGGSIRYIYNKPVFGETSLEVSSGIGQNVEAGDLSYQLDGIFNTSLGDNLALRISIGREERAGFIDYNNLYVRRADGSPELDNGSTDPIGDSANFFAGQPVLQSVEDGNESEVLNARVALRWQPNDDFDATLSYTYQDDEYDNTPMVRFDGDARERAESFHVLRSPGEREVNILSLEGSQKLSFATLSFAFSDYEQTSTLNTDLTDFQTNLGFYPFVYGSSPLMIADDFFAADQQGTVAELRLSSDGEGKLDWLVGGFYHDQDEVLLEGTYLFGYNDYAVACFNEGFPFGGEPCGFGTIDGLPGFEGVPKDLDITADRYTNLTDKAVFAEITYRFTDEWQVTAGGRYFDQELDTRANQSLPLSFGFDPDVFGTAEASDSVFRVNSSYHINEDTMLYFNWAEGFRRGGVNGLPITVSGTVTDSRVQEFTPDTTENLELGVKGSLAGGRYRYTATVFQTDWSDIQLDTLCTSRAFLCTINVGEAEVNGVELSLEGQITDRLMVTMSYAHLDSEITSLSQDTQGLLDNGTLFFRTEKGLPLPGGPDHSGYIDAFYTQPLNNGMELVYGGSAAYRGEVWDTATTDSGITEGYWLIDGSVRLNADKWAVSLFVKNIADERAFIGLQSRRTYGDAQHGYITTPRTFGINARYRFGD